MKKYRVSIIYGRPNINRVYRWGYVEAESAEAAVEKFAAAHRSSYRSLAIGGFLYTTKATVTK